MFAARKFAFCVKKVKNEIYFPVNRIVSISSVIYEVYAVSISFVNVVKSSQNFLDRRNRTASASMAQNWLPPSIDFLSHSEFLDSPIISCRRCRHWSSGKSFSISLFHRKLHICLRHHWVSALFPGRNVTIFVKKLAYVTRRRDKIKEKVKEN